MCVKITSSHFSNNFLSSGHWNSTYNHSRGRVSLKNKLTCMFIQDLQVCHHLIVPSCVIAKEFTNEEIWLTKHCWLSLTLLAIKFRKKQSFFLIFFIFKGQYLNNGIEPGAHFALVWKEKVFSTRMHHFWVYDTAPPSTTPGQDTFLKKAIEGNNIDGNNNKF